jgi:hypothetical protein
MCDQRGGEAGSPGVAAIRNLRQRRLRDRKFLSVGSYKYGPVLLVNPVNDVEVSTVESASTKGARRAARVRRRVGASPARTHEGFIECDNFHLAGFA